MTIEVKQLVIRAVVDERRRRAELEVRPAETRRTEPRPQTSKDVGRQRDALIAECTRRVLRELQRRQGR